MILIQETWLLSTELTMLNNIHHDFYGHGISTWSPIWRVGLGILYMKSIATMCNIVHFYDDRIHGI